MMELQNLSFEEIDRRKKELVDESSKTKDRYERGWCEGADDALNEVKAVLKKEKEDD